MHVSRVVHLNHRNQSIKTCYQTQLAACWHRVHPNGDNRTTLSLSVRPVIVRHTALCAFSWTPVGSELTI